MATLAGNCVRMGERTNFASQQMLNADVFNLTLSLTPNCTFSAHVCIILLSSHTLGGHCMQKSHSQRNSIHLQFCNFNCVQLAKQGLREGKGSNAQCLQLPRKMKQPFLVERPHLQTAFAVILLLHFLSLRETCAPEHALLMSAREAKGRVGGKEQNSE